MEEKKEINLQEQNEGTVKYASAKGKRSTMENETGTNERAETKPAEHKEISEKEARIRALTRLYYSNPKLQQHLLSFAAHREVVSRY